VPVIAPPHLALTHALTIDLWLKRGFNRTVKHQQHSLDIMVLFADELDQ
jgi:hypothetical protein